jgi:signal transduction histidine kinase
VERTVEATQPYAYQERRRGIRQRSFALEAPHNSAALDTYKAALDLTSEAVMICDRAGTIVYANASAGALMSDAGLVGRSVLQLVSSDARCTVRGILGQLYQHGTWSGLLTVPDRGAQRELAITLGTVGCSTRQPHHFCVTARAPAVTPPAESRILSAVGRVAGEIAHDFNNQIAVVLNYSFILLRKLPGGSPLRDHVSEMQGAAWRASQVAQELLDFSGRQMGDGDDLDVNALLQGLQPILVYTLRGSTRTETKLAADLWRVRARRPQLEWLLVELTARLRQALGPIAELRITTSNACGPDGDETGPARAIVFAREPNGRERNARSVLIGIEAMPQTAAAAQPQSLLETIPDASATGMRVGPSGLRAAELTLSHSSGELTIERLAGDGARYVVRLPAI